MKLLLANQSTAAKRRVYFDCRDAVDGLTAETGEAGGQPQVSTDGGVWTNTGIGTLTHLGNGRYYAELTQGLVANAGEVITTRYKSSATCETPGTTVQVVAFDPDVVSLGLSLAKGTNLTGLNDLSAAQVNTENDTALSDYGALKPTVAGRTLDVTATGAAGLDWGNVENKTSSNLLTGTTILLAGSTAYVVNDILAEATAQAGGATTITLESGSIATDDYYNGQIIRLVGGTGADQARTIIDYVGSTKVATVDRTWVVNPDNTTDYRIMFQTGPKLDGNLAVTVGTNSDKTGYTLTQAFPANFSSLAINGSGHVVLQDGSLVTAKLGTFALAKGTHITGFNDIAATDIVSSGAIATSGGAVSTVTNLTNAPTNGDLTATMKASVQTAATAATPTVTVGTNNDKTGYSLSAGGVQAVWDALTSALTTTGSIGKRIVDLFSGMTSLPQWLGLLSGKQTGNSTARTELRATGAGSGTYDETTDSQEATRDRGDAAWTGVGTGLTSAEHTHLMSIDPTFSTVESALDEDDVLTLVEGDDYTLRPIPFTVTNDPDLTGGTASLGIMSKDDYEADNGAALVTLTGTVTIDGDNAVLSFSPTAAQLAALSTTPPEGNLELVYQVRATVSSKNITTHLGAVTFKRSVL